MSVMVKTISSIIKLCSVIVATADKPEDQCEMEGCGRPKLKEGTRVHDYCCRSHADQDAPNRAG